MLHGKYLHKIDRFDFIIKFCISQLPASVSFETFCPYGMIFSCTQKQISQKKHDDLAAAAGKYLPMSAVRLIANIYICQGSHIPIGLLVASLFNP
jgi:hypothetical protein